MTTYKENNKEKIKEKSKNIITKNQNISHKKEKKLFCVNVDVKLLKTLNTTQKFKNYINK